MADAADKLSKLARLKNLKSGMKAKRDVSADDDDVLTLDSVIGETEKPQAKPEAPEPPAPTKKAEPDAESLSAYFEALGIVPDSAALNGVSGGPPKPYAPPSDQYTKPKADQGREVDARDRWVDPVREDNTFLASFAGDAAPSAEEETDDADSLDSIIGSFEDDEEKAAEPEEAVTQEPPLAVPVEEPTQDVAEDPARDPDSFGNPADIEAFEREIAEAGKAASEPEETTGTDVPLTVTFDESRATLLEHVSKQMNCTIDDVVVTAIDWYLDALFGEDDPEMGAGGG